MHRHAGSVLYLFSKVETFEFFRTEDFSADILFYIRADNGASACELFLWCTLYLPFLVNTVCVHYSDIIHLPIPLKV